MEEVLIEIFALPGILITASMGAYLVAQLVDIRVFHLVKELQIQNIYGSEIIFPQCVLN